ncbi:conserved hypothetical protein [Vibrio chagasii]|nr:conserved hypothetical protein [Vibrio chagasii]
MLLPPNVKKARLSAEALAKSFNMSSESARNLLAACYEVRGWDAFCSLVSQSSNNTNTSASEINQTNEFLMAKVAANLDIPQSKYLKSVIESCSPFSNKPKVLAYDIETVQAKDEDSVDLAQMMDMVDMDEGFNSLIDMMAQSSDIDPEFLEQIKDGGLDEFQNRMRLSKPLDPFFFMLAVDKVTGWETSDESFDFEHGVPAFYYFDQHDEEHPVFINSACLIAGDTGDVDTLASLIHIVEDGYDEEFEKPIILFGSAPHRKIGDDTFSTMGIWFDGVDWRWLFLCKQPPWVQKQLYPEGIVDNLENTLLAPPPPKELAGGIHESGMPDYHVYHCLSNPSSDPTTDDPHDFNFDLEPRPVVGGHSGWSSLI